jgi:hypothetical protein
MLIGCCSCWFEDGGEHGGCLGECCPWFVAARLKKLIFQDFLTNGI